ncbi:MAG TPA: PhoU domain-containing protein, partial [Bacillota bacterium]|nr:PhoU domain-containing protein [Bacillota bacterium]
AGKYRNGKTLVFIAFSGEDNYYVELVDIYEKKVDELRDRFRESHIKRLNKGECNISAGVLFLEILTNLERISDHCVNVADVVRVIGKPGPKLDRKTEIMPEKC